MKEWTVEVFVLDEAGREKPARCFQKVVYNLHPSFENPVQSKYSGPCLFARQEIQEIQEMQEILEVLEILTEDSFSRASFQVHKRGLGRV